MSQPDMATSLRRQESLLDLRRQLQVVLQRSLLLGRQALQTNPDQRIFRQFFAGNRAQAHFADSKSAMVNAMQRAVDLTQQAQYLVALVLSQHVGQPCASSQQLLADAVHVNRFTNCHG